MEGPRELLKLAKKYGFFRQDVLDLAEASCLYWEGRRTRDRYVVMSSTSDGKDAWVMFIGHSKPFDSVRLLMLYNNDGNGHGIPGASCLTPLVRKSEKV